MRIMQTVFIFSASLILFGALNIAVSYASEKPPVLVVCSIAVVAVKEPTARIA